MLGDINVTARTGAVVIAVVRGSKSHPNPSPKLSVLTGDILILLGSHVQLDQSLKVLRYGYEGQEEKTGRGIGN
jgi:K+/H+ antiporter YhaU regulatory subunit KhtT